MSLKNELVNVVNGKAVCTSLMVAEKFGKEHKNILQSIQNLECSQGFRELNFQLSSYTSLQGKEFPNDAIHQHCRKGNKINYGVLRHGINVIAESVLSI